MPWVIKLLLHFKPLPSIPFVRSGNFAVNVPPSSVPLARSHKPIVARVAQLHLQMFGKLISKWWVLEYCSRRCRELVWWQSTVLVSFLDISSSCDMRSWVKAVGGANIKKYWRSGIVMLRAVAVVALMHIRAEERVEKASFNAAPLLSKSEVCVRIAKCAIGLIDRGSG